MTATRSLRKHGNNVLWCSAWGFETEKGMRYEDAFLLKENKIKLSQNKTGYFKMQKGE